MDASLRGLPRTTEGISEAPCCFHCEEELCGRGNDHGDLGCYFGRRISARLATATIRCHLDRHIGAGRESRHDTMVEYLIGIGRSDFHGHIVCQLPCLGALLLTASGIENDYHPAFLSAPTHHCGNAVL